MSQSLISVKLCLLCCKKNGIAMNLEFITIKELTD